MRKVRVLINPKSGLRLGIGSLFPEIQEHWDLDGIDLSYQISKSTLDGQAKARRAVEAGVDTVLVAGGDGMINTIGSVLVDTPAALGVIPTGSGNGFARHFEIPLNPAKAIAALAKGKRIAIDVGRANGRPFFVTCSMAWDASIVRSFEKSPMRGILPYIFAGAMELLEYDPQPFSAILDGTRHMEFPAPMVFTAANLSQFGGGAQIAPGAKPDDGYLQLVVVNRDDSARILPKMHRLFDGTLDRVEEVETQQFQHLVVQRGKAAAIQVDGELMDPVRAVEIDVLPKALQIIVPNGA